MGRYVTAVANEQGQPCRYADVVDISRAREENTRRAALTQEVAARANSRLVVKASRAPTF